MRIITQALQYTRDNFMSRPTRKLRRTALPGEAPEIRMGRAAADFWSRTGIKNRELWKLH
jgi:hypothetical protein